ncbi:MAG: bifunctional NADH-specific enoyl-ACP reductase/trans-2-enoyl-CoA reductase, partial [Treponema sp.]|nr:bifunctional NADH-specific enoyl-ACP reductase/trans-2-enoyl-CoA reductase [Candidatus Treponema equi]
EDWERWIKQLSEAGVLAEGCRTVAYSYIGPALSHPIYRDGTIGEAKKDLEARAKNIDAALKANGGAAYVSVNKALITRSSSVIPIICQYIGVLFKIMKAKGTHEGCIEQMERLFAERLYTADKKVAVDEENRIRMDDWEMDAAVQAEVDKIMPQVTEETVFNLCDMDQLRHDFLAINGFDIAGIDYEKDVADMSAID